MLSCAVIGYFCGVLSSALFLKTLIYRAERAINDGRGTIEDMHAMELRLINARENLEQACLRIQAQGLDAIKEDY